MPLDRYLYFGDKSALSANAVKGLMLFRGRAECTNCHLIGLDSAPLTDHQFHGVAFDFEKIGRRLPEITQAVANADARMLERWIAMDTEVASLGRFTVTKNPQDIGKFRTPSLRNVMLTAPYMHDGAVPSLEAAIEFEIYYRSLQRNRPLILTPQERADILEFLRHLTSESAVAGARSRDE
jgi:cytochrome c peroxidase